jgi:hypothetical protein
MEINTNIRNKSMCSNYTEVIMWKSILFYFGLHTVKAGIFQIVGVGVVFKKLGMGSSREAT